MWDARQAIEIFHLLFLRALGARADKALFALKGGCNLRFFLKSIRYSEDLDLDIRTMSPDTLRNHVDRLIGSPQFVRALHAQSLEIIRVSAPKQTEVTPRWKLALRVGDSSNQVPTKIEFSRRGLDAGTAVEPVDAEIIRGYRLYPVIAQHYRARAAFGQKVMALALRSQAQARDVFDLKLLLDAGAAEGSLDIAAAAQLPRAIDHAMSVDYDAFAGQVLAYLAPEYQDHYRRRNTWNALQQQVVEALEALGR